MKMKKIMSAIVAGAMAATTFAAMSTFTASADGATAEESVKFAATGLSKIDTITVTLTYTGNQEEWWCGFSGGIGFNCTEIVDEEADNPYWGQVEWSNDTVEVIDGELAWDSEDPVTVSFTADVSSFAIDTTSDIMVQAWWSTYDTVTIDDIEFEGTEGLVADTLYSQATEAANGVYSERFVVMISEEEAEASDSVSFTLSNGSSSTTVTSDKYYTSVSAAGETLTPDDGYVFVAYAVTNVPEGVTLTASYALD